MWWCFSNFEDLEVLRSCVAVLELRAQVRVLRSLLVVFGGELPERVRRALVEAIEEAEAVLDDFDRGPVVGVLRRYLG